MSTVLAYGAGFVVMWCIGKNGMVAIASGLSDFVRIITLGLIDCATAVAQHPTITTGVCSVWKRVLKPAWEVNAGIFKRVMDLPANTTEYLFAQWLSELQDVNLPTNKSWNQTSLGEDTRMEKIQCHCKTLKGVQCISMSKPVPIGQGRSYDCGRHHRLKRR
jgi:hypothetical protein